MLAAITGAECSISDTAVHALINMDLTDKAIREREEKIRFDEICADVKNIVSTESGRRFYWTLLESAHIFAKCYTGTVDTYYNEGARDLGLRYFDLLFKSAPEMFSVMQKEAAERSEARQAAALKAREEADE